MTESETALAAKKTLQYFYTLLGSTAVTLTFPYIIFKIVRTFYLKNRRKNLEGKVVVITGASSGLGEALAHEFYKNGCQVVLCARRRQELERVRNDLLQMYATLPTHPPIVIPLDLEDVHNLSKVVNKIISITSNIDILINNGGISQRGSVIETDINVDYKIMNINYFGTIALTKAVLPHMMKKKEGHIVFISSIQGLIALPNRSAYGASKHALQAFGDSLRAEVSLFNISVTVVSPGYIKTSLSSNALTGSGDAYNKMDETTANGFSPEYVARRVFQAIIKKNNEVVISSVLPRIAIFLRKFIPWVYFFIMSKRAVQKG